MRRLGFALLLVSAALAGVQAARAAETDQFMTWNVELEDSAPVISAFLNKMAQEYVEKRNRSNVKTETLEEMGAGFYLYLFQGLHSSRVRNFVSNDDEIERYPANKSPWAYQRESIYRGLSFPYMMPMARTICVGGVYTGIDKLSHFFGFGRRYYQRYQRLRADGMTHEEAIERVIANGVAQESSLVGGLVDGVFSHGDLEANFQGCRMLLDLTDKASPFFVKKGEDWKTNGAIDIARYVTPGFDESYNISYYTFFRWRKVAPTLHAKYCGAPEVRAKLHSRYAAYDQRPKSAYMQYMEAQFTKTGNPRFQHVTIDEICARPTVYAKNK
jgi:hypothetical protein